MLKYRVVSFIVGLGMGMLNSYLFYTMDHNVGLFSGIISFFVTFLVASMTFTYFQGYDARIKNTPLNKQDISKIRKQRLVIIVIWFVATIIIYANDFGKFRVSLFALYFSTLIAVVVHYFTTNRTYSAAVQSANKRAEELKANRQVAKQKQEENHIISEQWIKLSHEIEKRMEDLKARSVRDFFKIIDRHKATLEQEPLEAASYPYMVEYLPYSGFYSAKMAELKRKGLSRSTEELLLDFDEFIDEYFPLSEGYFERKAAHQASLKSANKISGINDI